MMQSLLSILNDLCRDNQILATVTSGSLVVWLVTNIKTFYFTLKRWIMNIISFSVYNLCEMDAYAYKGMPLRQQMFAKLLSQSKSLWERSINLNFSSDVEATITEFSKASDDHILTYGRSIKVLFGKLCIIERSYQATNNKNNVIITIRVFFSRKKPFLEKLNAQLDKMVDETRAKNMKSDYLYVYTTNASIKKQKRDVSSIFTPGDVHLKLLDDVKTFLSSKQIYKDMNYPHKYACMLYGVPGTGKTSTILALATALQRDIKYINLSTTTVHMMLEQFSGVYADQYIYVFEDIDALNSSSITNRETDGKTSVANQQCTINFDDNIKILSLSLSDLLNLTDGLLSADGAIFLFTTNHINKLDPALLRAGRMNKLVEFKYLDSQTAAKMVKAHLGEDIVDLRDDIKPAELQDEILSIKTKNSSIEKLKQKFCK